MRFDTTRPREWLINDVAVRRAERPTLQGIPKRSSHPDPAGSSFLLTYSQVHPNLMRGEVLWREYSRRAFPYQTT
jgi:hypothetical protein